MNINPKITIKLPEKFCPFAKFANDDDRRFGPAKIVRENLPKLKLLNIYYSPIDLCGASDRETEGKFGDVEIAWRLQSN